MLLEYVVERFSYFQHAEGLPDAITTIQSLEDQEHALFMITASGDRAFSSAQQWCKAHEIFYSPSEMYSVDRYNSKAELVDALKLDVFVDNNLDQLTMIRQHFLNKDKIMPQPGLQVNIDGHLGIIKTVTGGRTLVDFNHPLSGKDVVYEITVHKTVIDPKEQVLALLTMKIPAFPWEVQVENKTATITTPKELPKSLQDQFAKEIQESVFIEKIEWKAKS